MNESDVIDRLRRTYAAVAEQTLPELSDAPATRLAVVGAEPHEQRHRPRRLLAAAACLLVLLGSLGVAIAVRRHGKPTVSGVEAMIPRLRHAALGYIPKGFGLVEVDAAGDRLVYSDGSRQLVLRVVPVADPPGDERIEVRTTLASVYRSDGLIRVQWQERSGAVVEIDAPGAWSNEELAHLAQSVVMVSSESWRLATTQSGFFSATGLDSVVLDSAQPGFTVVDGKPLTASLYGSLQHGLRVAPVGVAIFVGLPDVAFQGLPAVPSQMVYPELGDRFQLIASAPVASVQIVVRGTLRKTVKLVAHPSVPWLMWGSFAMRLSESDRTATVVRFLDQDGALINEQALQ
ncbi:MAG: hypothetical protein WCO88_02650 [Actinomycetota bacterium]